MDLLGFEPRAFRMQSERDTTTPQALNAQVNHLDLFIPNRSFSKKPAGVKKQVSME
jgi:hypothetical protein